MVQPDWGLLKNLSTLFICRRRDNLPRMATTGLDNLCDK